jgi:hypothetical protein
MTYESMMEAASHHPGCMMVLFLFGVVLGGVSALLFKAYAERRRTSLLACVIATVCIGVSTLFEPTVLRLEPVKEAPESSPNTQHVARSAIHRASAEGKTAV